VLMAVLCLSPYETEMSVLNFLTVTNCIGQDFHENFLIFNLKTNSSSVMDPSGSLSCSKKGGK
jgi:hypothetical protein